MQSEWGHASRAQDLRRRIGSADVFARGAVSMDAPSEVSVPELPIVGDPLPRPDSGSEISQPAGWLLSLNRSVSIAFFLLYSSSVITSHGKNLKKI